MKFVDVQFSDFIPDRAGTPWPSDPGYLVDAEDIYPTPNGWRAYAAATNVAAATAVPSTSGADIEAAFIERNGTTANIFAMTETTWFQSDDLGVTWNNVTPATAVGAVSGWERFDDLVVITPFGGQPREKDITGTVTAQFSDLTGFSGGAVDVGRIRDHLFIATTTGVRWSSIGDPQDYPTPGGASALASQAGSETLPGQLGQTRAVCGGEKFGVVFQQRGISRFTYVGGDVVYTVDTFEKNIGLGDGQALAVKRVGDLFYFTNYEGVFVTDGYSVRRLSYGQIDESLFTGLVSSSDSFVPSLLSTQSIAVDFARDCVLFAPDGYGKLIGCNYRLNKFFTLSDTTLISLLAGPSGSSYSDYQLLGFDSSQKLRQYRPDSWSSCQEEG